MNIPRIILFSCVCLCGFGNISCRPQLHESYKRVSRIGSYIDSTVLIINLDTTKQRFDLFSQHPNSMVGNRYCAGSFHRNKNKLELIPFHSTYTIDPDPNSNRYNFIVIDHITGDTLDFYAVHGGTFDLDTIVQQGNFTLPSKRKGEVLIFPCLQLFIRTQLLKVPLKEFGTYTIIRKEWNIGEHLLHWKVKRKTLVLEEGNLVLFKQQKHSLPK